MNVTTAATIAEMRDDEQEILALLDERVERLTRWAEETANPAFAEMRREAEMYRVSHGRELRLGRQAIESLFLLLERVDRSLEENSRVTQETSREVIETLRALRRDVTGRGNGSEGDDAAA
jgi:hypothetical protein